MLAFPILRRAVLLTGGGVKFIFIFTNFAEFVIDMRAKLVKNEDELDTWPLRFSEQRGTINIGQAIIIVIWVGK